MNAAGGKSVKVEMRLAEMLEKRGRSAYWLSKQTGISQSVIWRIKTGKTKGIEYRILALICLTLECQPGDLLVLAAAELDTKRKPKSNA
ncbi:MAG: helix-turn-helix domain-containing protein [Blastocatellia bacterium]